MATRTYLIGGGSSTKASIEQYFEYMKSLAADHSQPTSVYQTVAWAYRCVQLRANALSSIPWVVTQGDAEIDWPINMEWLWWQTEASLLLFGAAYWLKLRNRVRLVDLQFLNAQTIRVKRDSERGIVGFEQRTRRGGLRKFKPEEVVYFRMWNPSDDLGPGLSPMRVVSEAAGLMANANAWAANFFAHGAIPAVILSTEQNPPDVELERIRTVWNQLTAGVKKAWRTVVLRGGLKPTIVGAPIKDLAMTALMQSVRQQIAIAFGVPESMVGDPASNYATARTNRISFWQETIIPEAVQLEAMVNEQLFEPLGLRFRFQINMIEAIQQDEAEKADAIVKQYEAGILTLDEARAQMGYEPIAPAESGPSQPDTGQMLADLRRWRTKARKRSGLCEFKSEYIPDGMAQTIRSMIKRAGVEPAFMFLKSVPEGREAAEQRLTEKIAQQLNSYLDTVANTIVNGGEPNYEDVEKSLLEVLQTELTNVAVEQTLREAAAAGIDVDLVVINKAAMEWAREYSYDLVKGLTDTTRGLVREVIARFTETPGMTIGDVRNLLSPAFGEMRAKLIGITEITRAYSRGTLIYQQLIRGYGIDMVRVWQTSADDRVCPICGSLHGQLEEDWADRFADGPPAHPGCRCWTNLQLAD